MSKKNKKSAPVSKPETINEETKPMDTTTIQSTPDIIQEAAHVTEPAEIPASVPAPETPAAAEPPAAPVQEAPKVEPKKVIAIPTLAEAIVAAIPDLTIRPTKASGYRVLVTSVSPDDTYKKGIFFQVDGGQKSLNFKLQLSYNKWCNWLTAHVAEVKALATEGLTWAKDRDVGYLQAKLPMTMTLEEMVAKCKALYETLNPVVLKIRAAAPAPAPKGDSKKDTTPAAAPAPETPAATEGEAPAAAPEVPPAE